MHQPKDDLSRSLVTLDQDRTLIGVVELSLKTWLVGGIVPGIGREPLKKLVPDEDGLFRLLHRWRDEATRAGHTIKRIVVAFEAGRDGFWLARWLRARGVEAYIIHPTSIPVSREQRRAKTDRLDIGLLKRSFIGWLRGERKHCTMIAIPTLDDEDAKRPNREREQLVGKRTGIINRMKAMMMRLGIRGFNPKLRNASERLASCAHQKVAPFHPTRWLNSSVKWRIYVSLIYTSSKSRASGRSNSKIRREQDQTAKCCNWHASVAWASKRQICSQTRRSLVTSVTNVQLRGTRGSQAHPTKAVRDGARKVSPRRAMHGYVAA